MTHRDRQIICGLFLSKFDQDGLQYLGFENFTEAFNALGYSLRARPASIKNYRDEFDPYFPNERKGWYKRPLREHCRLIRKSYEDASLVELGELIKSFLLPTQYTDSLPDVARVLAAHNAEATSSFAKRLITGRAAEQYFTANFHSMQEFSSLLLTDTTNWGCGFDFKLATPSGNWFCAVEVKGLRARFGQIQLTELEHDMAEALSDRYYMVLVRNFVEQPFHTIVKDPLNCRLQFMKTERKEVRLSWTANVTE